MSTSHPQWPLPLPLDYFGMLLSLSSALACLVVTRLKDARFEQAPMVFVRRRAFDVNRLCRWKRLVGMADDDATWLQDKWVTLRAGLRSKFRPMLLARLTFHRFCPTWLRNRLPDERSAKLGLTPMSKCHATFDDEVRL